MDHLTRAQKGQAKKLGININIWRDDAGAAHYTVSDLRDASNDPVKSNDLSLAIAKVINSRAPEAIAEVQHPAIDPEGRVRRPEKKARAPRAPRTPAPATPKAKTDDRKRSSFRAKLERARAAEEGDDEAGADGEDAAAASGSASIVRQRYRIAYKAHGGTCGDKLAEALRTALVTGSAMDHVALYNVGDANAVDVKKRWGKLNYGQQRMNLGNALRAMLRRGEDVVIAGQVFKGVKAEPKEKARTARKAHTTKDLAKRRAAA